MRRWISFRGYSSNFLDCFDLEFPVGDTETQNRDLVDWLIISESGIAGAPSDHFCLTFWNQRFDTDNHLSQVCRGEAVRRPRKIHCLILFATTSVCSRECNITNALQDSLSESLLVIPFYINDYPISPLISLQRSAFRPTCSVAIRGSYNTFAVQHFLLSTPKS